MILKKVTFTILAGCICVFAGQLTVDAKSSADACSKVAKSKTIIFNASTVEGYQDNPDIVIVTDGNNAADNEIILNRSFRDEMTRNIDKETIERMN